MTRKALLPTAMDFFRTRGHAATTANDTTRVTFSAHFQPRSDLARVPVGELNDILGRGSSPEHGSTTGHLVRAVRRRILPRTRRRDGTRRLRPVFRSSVIAPSPVMM